jgi:hypothetical protein
VIITKKPYLLIFTLVIAMITIGFASAEDLPVGNIGGGVGYYDISSSPSDATVIFDGINKGTTPVVVEVSTSGTPGHSLSISKEGYRTYTDHLTGNPGEGQTVDIYR